MDKIKLVGSKNYIYYDIENRIIGRELTKSNIQENGPDNSLYFGLGNPNLDKIISSIFNVENLKDIVGKKYKLKLCDIFVEFEFNINDRDQRQLKMLNDGKRQKGRVYRAFNYFNKYNNLNLAKENIVFLLDLKNSELLIKHSEELSEESNNFENTVKQLIIEAKKEGINPEDLNGYISTQISARNSSAQNKFRNDLIEEFEGKCAICGIDKKELLIASHILPYHKCQTVNEMIDKNNGLLLCVTHDALFDKDYISFNQKGELIISKEIDKKMYDLLNIKNNFILNKKYLTNLRIRYLVTHKVK